MARLSFDSSSDAIDAYFAETYGVSVRPIQPPPEPALQHAHMPASGEALALDRALGRVPKRVIAVLSVHNALTHILFLKTSPRTALAAHSRGVIRLFPPALRLDVPDPVFGRLTLFEATILHELGEALYRLYLETDPRRVGPVRSLHTPGLTTLMDECYLWWLEEGEPPGFGDDAAPHLLAALLTTAVADPPRVRRGPMLELLRALGVIED